MSLNMLKIMILVKVLGFTTLSWYAVLGIGLAEPAVEMIIIAILGGLINNEEL